MKKITGYTSICLLKAYKKALLLGCFVALSLAGRGQTVKISGTVVDRQSHEPVPLVHIYNKWTAQGTVTDNQGRFLITIDRADTLVFSSVGFEKYLFHLTAENEAKSFYEVVIEMDPKTYELEPVKVTAYRTLEEFKRDILALDGVPDKKEGFSIEVPAGYKLPAEGATLPGNDPPAAIVRGPVSALYNAFSKEAKERKKLEAYHRQQNDRETVETKYNLEVVKRVTGLDESGAEKFMEWCKLEDSFILASSEYDLAVAMLKCLDEFNKKPVGEEK